MMNFWQYVQENAQQILTLTIEHIELTLISVFVATLIGVPLGILISNNKHLDKPITGTANLIQAIPSMALLGFMIPLFGIGRAPAIIAVVLYSLLPIIKNTSTGIKSVNKETLEAAEGIGLTTFQILMKVKLPLALPVIMAGVRISAVTAVGLITIAAYIGAGGLGFLVYSGISSLNTYQILAGAIPACILALSIDYLVGLIEKLVTPVSLQTKDGKTVKQAQKQKTKSKAILAIAVAVIVASFGWNIGVSKQGAQSATITIGGKDFAEQQILTHLVADIIEEQTDISVIRKPNLGGTQVNFTALKNGTLDMYVEYTGTMYSDILKHGPSNNVETVYDTATTEMKMLHDIDLLKPMGFNNTFVLAVTQETAQKYQLKTISDLVRVADTLRFGGYFEFLNREDGLPGVSKEYGFKFNQELAVNGSQRYIALNQGEIDVIDAFSTDGLLKKFDLMSLEDDLSFFPAYYPVPMVRGETLIKYPELETAINTLGPYLTEEAMIELNYRVDELQENPAKVARDFLNQNGLVKE